MSDNLVGATKAVFTVSLNVAVSELVAVEWSTRDGTAKAGTDYEATNGIVSFSPGETVKQFEVTVYGQEFLNQEDKSFFVALSPPSNAVLNSSLLECVITTDGDAAVLSIIVPQGKRGFKGDPGLSAYEQAVLMGYEGTLEDWIKNVTAANDAADRAEAAAEAAADTNVTAQAYNAKGDGVTNDTQAFIDLESVHTGRIVDLHGKTYLVDNLPSEKNTYINGFFKLEGSVVTSKGDFKTFSDTSVSPFSLDVAGQLWSTRAQMVRYTAGASSVVQSIAVDEVNRYMYSLTASTPALICRYDYDKKLYNQSIDQNNDVNGVLGHQGLAVEQLGGGETLLWTSSNTAPNTGSSAHTFKYKPLAEGAITLEEDWILFPKDGVGQSITPNISVDQRYLIVMRQFNEADGSGVWVRVFDMQDIKTFRKIGKFDIQNEYLSEFKYKDIGSPAEVSRQDVACDGYYIYILWGTWRTDTEDYILKFNLRGKLVQKYDCHHIGLQNSIDGGTEGQHEPEGLCFVSSPKGGYTLLYQVAFGDTGGRKCWIYELGGEQPISSYTDNKPALLLNSNNGVEICAPTDMPIRFGTYSNSAGFTKHLTIDKYGRILKGIAESVAIAGTTNGLQWYATSTQANMVLGRWASGASQYPQLMLFKSSATNIGDSVANPSGVTLGGVGFYTDIGTGTASSTGVLSAGITASTTGAVVNEKSPSRLDFSTTSSSGNYTARWAILSNGDLVPVLSGNYPLGGPLNQIKSTYSKAIYYSATVFSTSGTGSPEGVLAAGVGSTYYRTDGNAGTTLYTKESGVGNTGWVDKNSIKGLKLITPDVYENNTDAINGGLKADDIYRTSLGVVMVVF